jgi:hypothetical protein
MASKMVPVKREQIEFYLVRGPTMAIDRREAGNVD